MGRKRTFLAILVWTLFAAPALGAGDETQVPVTDLEGIEQLELPALDVAAIQRRDEERVSRGRVAHYAHAYRVQVTPWSRNLDDWQVLPPTRARWRLRITSPGALSLNLRFQRFELPPRGRLLLYSADGRHRLRPLTALDNEPHGELWTPPIPTDDLIVELRVPLEELDRLDLELTQVQHGYAGFGAPPPRAGDCHPSVACAEAEPWRDVARSVGLVSIEGVRFCTGFLVNNTALDGRPLFLTASHCGVSADNAASLVVMWSHVSDGCDDDRPAGDLTQFQSGATVRALDPRSDAVLLELDDPPDPAFGVYYAGWDRTAADPEGVAVIHHPNTDVKRIALDFDSTTTTAHLAREPGRRGDHLRVGSWEVGSTEGGSSGAPLFDRHGRAVGQLHGGWASCGERRADWFGRLSTAWDRLGEWLDPLATGVPILDGLDSLEVAAHDAVLER